MRARPSRARPDLLHELNHLCPAQREELRPQPLGVAGDLLRAPPPGEGELVLVRWIPDGGIRSLAGEDTSEGKNGRTTLSSPAANFIFSGRKWLVGADVRSPSRIDRQSAMALGVGSVFPLVDPAGMPRPFNA